jgi:hypothetical protein
MFLAAMCTVLRPQRVVETGAYRGYTTRAMGEALVGVGHLDSLEINPEYIRLARAATKGLPVTIHSESSLTFRPRQPVDFVFFDSEYDLRPQEMIRFREFASTRCVWALHDSRVAQLQRALADLSSRSVIKDVCELPTPRGLAIGRYRQADQAGTLLP